MLGTPYETLKYVPTMMETPHEAELRKYLEAMGMASVGAPDVEPPVDPALVAESSSMPSAMDALAIPAVEPPAIAVPMKPRDPLAPNIPNAPAPVDLAKIRLEETEALTKERGPRIKANPKGWKGFLLGLAKGAVGLAEGYAKSGARDFMGALPSMYEGAAGRIDQYRTNREDYQPFDDDLRDRVRQRVTPLLERYAQDRQVYGDALDRYKLEDEEYDQTDQRTFRDTQAEETKGQRERVEKRYNRQLDEQIRKNRAAEEARILDMQTKTKIALERIADGNVRREVTARTKALDKQFAAMATTEKDLLAQQRSLRSHLATKYGIYGDETPAVDDPKVTAARVRLAEIDDQLEDIESDKAAILNRYTGIAQEVYAAAPAPAPARGGRIITKAEALAIIDQKLKAGKITPEVAAAKRAEVEAVESGGR